MRICEASLLTDGRGCPIRLASYRQLSAFMSVPCSSTPILRLPGHGSLAWKGTFTSLGAILLIFARREAAKRALENAQKLEPGSPETLLALGYYQYHVLRDYGLAKVTFGRLSKLLPGGSEAPHALALIARREGHWEESIAYLELALTLDPRNVEMITYEAWDYAHPPTILSRA